jgi:hypothetical protein
VARPEQERTMSEKEQPRQNAPDATKSGAPRPEEKAGAKNTAGAEFDFAIEEIAPNERLKEGFTGQER